jgi:hypothetical protein
MYIKLTGLQVRYRCISAPEQIIQLIRTSAITISSHEGSLGSLARLYPRIDVEDEADEPEVEKQRSHGA